LSDPYDRERVPDHCPVCGELLGMGENCWACYRLTKSEVLATRLRKLIWLLGSEGRCECGAKVYWVRTRKYKKLPLNEDGVVHMDTCPMPKRKPKPKPKDGQ
jgi:hypothetical protein